MPGHYHSLIGGDGRVHRIHACSVDLPAHTYGRERNSVAISCACMGGIPDPWTQPPTPAQLISLCAEAAVIAHSLGWQEGDISLQSVMAHAEAASNCAFLRGDSSLAPSSPLAFKGETVIQARGVDLAVQIDALGRSWAIAADLLSRCEISYAWDASHHRILIGALDVAPTYCDDAVQASVGWPLVKLTLQNG